jgi:hypothetical protein
MRVKNESSRNTLLNNSKLREKTPKYTPNPPKPQQPPKPTTNNKIIIKSVKQTNNKYITPIISNRNNKSHKSLQSTTSLSFNTLLKSKSKEMNKTNSSNSINTNLIKSIDNKYIAKTNSIEIITANVSLQTEFIKNKYKCLFK